MQLIEGLKWRYATKKYDPTKKVSDSDLETIKEAVQLSASSYGLQLYKTLIVQDSELREKLKAASWNQSPVTDASHFLIFCSVREVMNEDIDDFVQLKAKTQNKELKEFDGYGNFIKSKMEALSIEEKQNWTSKQTYIALANAMNACAELKIDSTPMEGFDPQKVDEILDLKSKNLTASVMLAIGYRSEEDATQNQKKVRRSKEEIFEVI